MKKAYSKAAAGTFKLNKCEPIHRWYSYLEGYSSCLIDDLILEIGPQNIKTIYDPFCGTGTTPLVASKYGIASYYSETNPFMKMVIEAKINCVKRLRDSGAKSLYLRCFSDKIRGLSSICKPENLQWDGFEKYYDSDVLSELQQIKTEIDRIEDDDSRQIALIILASVLVKSSKMIRQGDLRFAKDTEKSASDKALLHNYIEKLENAISDIESEDCPTVAYTTCLSEDSRNITVEDQIDCVITSPPYLNGTNYIRNTKLELKLAGFVTTEKDLPALHSKGIIAGINNVSKRKESFETPECVLPYIEQLNEVAYDKRIPTMVSGYFNDMESVISKLSIAIVDNGIFIMDIGDSQFAGIHIPTHEILMTICKKYGFELYSQEVLRQRRSKNGMILTQRLLKFKLHKNNVNNISFAENAVSFIRDMPYRQSPFSGRNWGHPLHSLCSYHGKLKPSIAHFLVEQFTKPGDVVLDPLCGVGTIPLEACLQGRKGIGNDLSEMAYIVTKAKLEKPSLQECQEVIADLSAFLSNNIDLPCILEDILKYEAFGFNGKIRSYFHPETYKEILCARRFFLSKIQRLNAAEAMVYSCFLHVLHGNRPYALSRNSHPLTPYAPKGDFVYKNVIEHISAKLALTYAKGPFDSFVQGKAVFGDYNTLLEKGITADAVICSPPFADSIRFYMQNWMRLWLCGWETDDYKKADEVFLDQRQKKNFDIYCSFFEMCSKVLKESGKVILHLGKTGKIDMAEELSLRATPWFDEIFRGCENVMAIEKHGIKDKGGTIEHQFLFLQKK